MPPQQRHSERALSPIFGSYGGLWTIPPISSRSWWLSVHDLMCSDSCPLPPWRLCRRNAIYSPEIGYPVDCSRYGSAAARGRTEVRRQAEPPKGKTSPRHRSDESFTPPAALRGARHVPARAVHHGDVLGADSREAGRVTAFCLASSPELRDQSLVVVCYPHWITHTI